MLHFLGEVFLEVFCLGTGHFVLWAASLGRWKRLNGHDDVATLFGVLLWIGIAAVVWLAFFWR